MFVVTGENEIKFVHRGGPTQEDCATAKLGTKYDAAIWHPTDFQVAIKGWADEVTLWNGSTGEAIRSFACPVGVGSVSISADGKLIACGSLGNGGGRYIRHGYIYRIDTGELVAQLSENDFQINGIVFGHDHGSDYVITAGHDLCFWKLNGRGPQAGAQLIHREATDDHPKANLIRVIRSGVLIFRKGCVEKWAFPAQISFTKSADRSLPNC